MEGLSDDDAGEGEWDRGLGRSILDISAVLRKILEPRSLPEESQVSQERPALGFCDTQSLAMSNRGKCDLSMVIGGFQGEAAGTVIQLSSLQETDPRGVLLWLPQRSNVPPTPSFQGPGEYALHC